MVLCAPNFHRDGSALQVAPTSESIPSTDSSLSLLHDSDFVGSNSHVEPQNRPCNAARPHGDLVAVQALCACRRLRRCGRGDFIPSALAVNPFFSPSSRAPYLGAGNVRVQTEARFGADSLEPLVRLHFFVAVTLSHALLKAIEFRFV